MELDYYIEFINNYFGVKLHSYQIEMLKKYLKWEEDQ